MRARPHYGTRATSVLAYSFHSGITKGQEMKNEQSTLLGDILFILFLIAIFPFAVIFDVMKRS